MKTWNGEKIPADFETKYQCSCDFPYGLFFLKTGRNLLKMNRLWKILAGLKFHIGGLLTIVGLVRILFLGSGACSLGDEFRYWFSAQMLLAGSHGNLAGMVGPMFETAGRPGLAILNLPPMILQSLLFKTIGLDPRNPDSLLIPQLFNIGWSLVAAYLFWKISLKLLRLTLNESLFLTTCFCLLTSSNLYLKHLLPYDQAMCIFLFAIICLLDKKNLFLIGLITAFAWSVYPGYWPLCLVAFSMTFIENQLIFNKKPVVNFIQKIEWKRPFQFAAGFLSLLILWQILSLISGKNYWTDSLFAGNEFLNYMQLKFDGSLCLFVDYLWSVEGLSGLFLIAGFLLFSIKSIQKLIKKELFSIIEITGFVLIAAFVLQSIIGWTTGMKVFYGRLFKPFLPFLLLISFDVFNRVVVDSIKIRLIKGVVFGSFFIHFIQFFIEFRQLGYPRDVFYQLNYCQKTDGLNYDIRVKTPPDDDLNRVFEFEPNTFFTRPPLNPRMTRCPAEGDSSLVFLNFSTLPVHLNGHFHAFHLPENYEWLLLKPHFAGFEPYFFEENPAAKRTFLNGNTLKIGVAQLIEH